MLAGSLQNTPEAGAGVPKKLLLHIDHLVLQADLFLLDLTEFASNGVDLVLSAAQNCLKHFV